MLDELFDIFERDNDGRPRQERRRGVRGLLDRLTGRSDDEERRDDYSEASHGAGGETRQARKDRSERDFLDFGD